MTTRASDSPIVVPIHPVAVIPPEVHETAVRLGVLKYLPQVIDLTREIFGSFSRVTVSEDPEFGDTHIIFHVPAQGTIEEDLDKDEQWGRRMLEIIPRSPQVYLVFAESPP
ncbi:MAG: hypothetical protein ACLQNE_27205 [Thermoguttaceae bacterium]